ncbi:MAG: hypothetical protein Q7T59_06035 [Candidatus Woesebacteria bacterium]|nr:hypothetical protein [Candidatus Woesebacteria bacterium]
MRKETALAIFAGISIGLITAFGIWKATSSIKRNTQESETIQTPATTPKQNLILTIANMSDFDVITESPKIVNGMTKSLSNIVISTADKDFLGKANEDGSFELEVKLPVGFSEIKAVSFDSKGDLAETKVKIIYSEEFEKYVDPTKKSKAYVGTVTDISGGTIQIKAINGEILQAGTADDTTYINVLKKSAVVKATDLAIGDYIVAMGLLNGNKVLSAKRILITSELIDDKKEIVWGKISEITKKKLTLIKNNGETLEIILPKTWSGPDVSDLSEDQTIIVAGNIVSETYSLRSIFTPVE